MKIDYGKIKQFLQIRPYAPSDPIYQKADIKSYLISSYYNGKSSPKVSVAKKLMKVIAIYEKTYGPLSGTKDIVIPEKLQKMIDSKLFTAYEINKLTSAGTTNLNLYLDGQRKVDSMSSKISLELMKVIPLYEKKIKNKR